MCQHEHLFSFALVIALLSCQQTVLGCAGKTCQCFRDLEHCVLSECDVDQGTECLEMGTFNTVRKLSDVSLPSMAWLSCFGLHMVVSWSVDLFAHPEYKTTVTSSYERMKDLGIL